MIMEATTKLKRQGRRADAGAQTEVRCAESRLAAAGGGGVLPDTLTEVCLSRGMLRGLPSLSRAEEGLPSLSRAEEGTLSLPPPGTGMSLPLLCPGLSLPLLLDGTPRRPEPSIESLR